MITRRQFITSTGASTGLAALTGCLSASSATGPKQSDVQVEGISHSYNEYFFRAPVGFAGAVVNRASIVTVKCSVRTKGGKLANGFGTMPFNHAFSFPSKTLSNETKNEAMKALAIEIAKVTSAFRDFGHPLEINWALAPHYLGTAAEVSKRLNLARNSARLSPPPLLMPRSTTPLGRRMGQIVSIRTVQSS